LKSTTTLSCMKEFENCLRRRRSRDAGDSLWSISAQKPNLTSTGTR
jgi:hypothetical protein